VSVRVLVCLCVFLCVDVDVDVHVDVCVCVRVRVSVCSRVACAYNSHAVTFWRAACARLCVYARMWAVGAHKT